MTNQQSDELRTTILEGFDKVDRRFDRVDERFEKVDGRLDRMDGRLDRMDGRFDRMDGRFDRMDGRFDRMDGRFDQMQAQLTEHGSTLARLDATVHRQGLEHEEQRGEIKLAIEAFQSAQKITNARIDLLRTAINNRLVPLELADRGHATALGEHKRRLENLENAK